MDPATVSVSIVVAAITNISFACAVGGCLAVLMLGGAPPVMRSRAQRFAAGCAVALIIANTISLLLEAALMSGSTLGTACAVLIPVLTRSHFGAAWSIGFVALIIWTGLLLRARDSGRATRMSVALFTAAVFAFSKAASSHAADAGDFALPEWIHWVHLCATATWAGLVIASGLCVLPMLRDYANSQCLAQFVERLSATATLALAAILMSGAYNADRGLGGSLVPLVRSEWGLILDAKLVFVGAAIILGGINRLVYLPSLRQTDLGGATASSFEAILKAEAAVMISILSAAAVLAHTIPGAHPGGQS